MFKAYVFNPLAKKWTILHPIMDTLRGEVQVLG